MSGSLASRTRIELIAIAYPVEANFGEIVKGYKVEISRHTMDGADTDLM
jgi:hypothetical protein